MKQKMERKAMEAENLRLHVNLMIGKGRCGFQNLKEMEREEED
jgi:hypothetical protein